MAQNRTFVQDGVIYEDLGNGQVRVVGYADQQTTQQPAPVRIGTPTQNAALETRSRELNIEKQLLDIQKAQQGQPPPSGYRYKADGTLEVIPGGPADKPRYRAMRQGDATHLESDVQAYSYLKEALGGFQDDFAGNGLDILGEGENWAQGYLGIGTPGQRDWWANFRTADNLIRNQLFGASLTSGEKSAYNQTTVSPGMAPAQVRANLARRVEIARTALARKVARLKAAGYNPDEIDAATGLLGADFSPEYKPGEDRQDNVQPMLPSQSSPPGSGGGSAPERVDTSSMPMLSSDVPDQMQLSETTKVVPNPWAKKYGARLGQMVVQGVPDAQIREFLRSTGGNMDIEPILRERKTPKAQEWIRRHPGTGWPIKDTMEVPMTPSEIMRAKDAHGPVGAFFTGAADAITFGNLDAFSSDPEKVRAEMGLVRQRNPGASLGGNIVGGALAAGGLETGLAGFGTRAPGMLGNVLRSPITADVLYGSAYGAGSNDEDRLAGAFGGGLTGGLGGTIGRTTTRKVGDAVSGVTDAGVRALQDRGIPLTIGQALGQSGRVGPFVKGMEDRLTGLPGIGNMINARRAEGVQAFNRSAFDEALAPIGVNTGGKIGEEGIAASDDLIGQAYTNALGGVRVSPDQQFATEMKAALGQGQAIPGLGDKFKHVMQTRVAPMFDQNTGELTGENMQAAIQGLRRARADFAADPLGYDFGQAATGAEDAITGLVGRQSPDTMPAFNAANQAYRNFSTLVDAVGDSAKNTGGIFTPAQLGMKASANAKRFGGKIANASGKRPFFDLQRAGQDILPSTVPDSGTAGRLIAPLALAGAGGGVGYASGDTQTGIMIGAGLAGAYSKPVQRFLVAALTKRPDSLVKAGTKIKNSARLGGMFGAPLALSFIGNK